MVFDVFPFLYLNLTVSIGKFFVGGFCSARSFFYCAINAVAMPPLVSFRGLNKRFPETRFVLGHETKVFTPGKGLF